MRRSNELQCWALEHMGSRIAAHFANAGIPSLLPTSPPRRGPTVRRALARWNQCHTQSTAKRFLCFACRQLIERATSTITCLVPAIAIG